MVSLQIDTKNMRRLVVVLSAAGIAYSSMLPGIYSKIISEDKQAYAAKDASLETLRKFVGTYLDISKYNASQFIKLSDCLDEHPSGNIEEIVGSIRDCDKFVSKVDLKKMQEFVWVNIMRVRGKEVKREIPNHLMDQG